ncbi:hypothetical protein CLOSTASPAR_04286 [[Clostridium] asparagiforme DSM 15981]|uniref:Uncharacterized protein n=1 Tax=[Clostridium] asparagiforme DSM 15981 TaxID=518636 RepID=C0D4U0_9FIRM|nr:hypothetical protein CLOSTASPAR_04286 [[Clostridium] asparagiforme DSM 15981]
MGKCFILTKVEKAFSRTCTELGQERAGQVEKQNAAKRSQWLFGNRRRSAFRTGWPPACSIQKLRRGNNENCI